MKEEDKSLNYEKVLVRQSYEAGWDSAKKELLKEFEDWFCNGYCQFYGLEDYCSTCPLKKEECWLKYKNQTI